MLEVARQKIITCLWAGVDFCFLSAAKCCFRKWAAICFVYTFDVCFSRTLFQPSVYWSLRHLLSFRLEGRPDGTLAELSPNPQEMLTRGHLNDASDSLLSIGRRARRKSTSNVCSHCCVHDTTYSMWVNVAIQQWAQYSDRPPMPHKDSHRVSNATILCQFGWWVRGFKKHGFLRFMYRAKGGTWTVSELHSLVLFHSVLCMEPLWV